MIQDKLTKEIESVLNQIGTLPVDSEGYEKAIKSLSVLMDKKASMEEAEYKRKEASRNSAAAQELEERKFRSERNDRICKNVLTGTGIVLSMGLTIWGTVATFEFEKTNSIASVLGKDWIKKVLPKK